MRRWIFLFLSLTAIAEHRYPLAPDHSLTPGSLCTSNRQRRYPENIRYCERHVSSETKRLIIRKYDQVLGTQVAQMPREDFKIDHYIPLCAGGSNETTNLWPQHVTVYELTDPLEPLICEKMADGELSQAEAVRIIKRAKARPETADAEVRRLRGED